ncbi:hypothetical protein B5F11_18425 [Anaerotruncus colihominis]|uniref:DUF4280 domain-containing protein n=1 Tax=Anaerotruncus colihominis TaxID=169435 RepID=A0A1Y4MH24_9FIRM|nr:PAAR-like protein [Anaerotruncus colihominis]OUP67369.1 hypothetical protein B5F11_18425 [Anaerotruncus colihominis]
MAVQVPAEEFVVEGAKMSCDKGSRNAVFKPPADRRMTILGGRVGIETDTSPEKNFEGDFGKCAAMSGKPCIKDFIDTWFLAEPSVSYSSGQAAPSNNAPPAVSPKEEGHLLLTSSILVCWRGGHITFSDSGQKLREFDPDNPEWIDERVHVVIRDRNEEPLLSAADGDNETSSAVGGLLALVLPAEDLDIYWNHSYDFTNYHAEIFLPIVFPDLSTERIFDGEYQEAIKLSKTSADEGSTRQEDMAEKVELLRSQCRTAHKLAYMIYYGTEAVEKYQEDLNNYFEALYENRSRENGFPQQDNPTEGSNLLATIPRELERNAKMSLTETIKRTKFYKMMAASNYGLWGKYYTASDGWHRGIDMNGKAVSGSNSELFVQRLDKIYAIADGYLITRNDYYFSLYNFSMNVTITYMHLKPTQNLEAIDQGALVRVRPPLVSHYSEVRDIEIQIAEIKRNLAKLSRKQKTEGLTLEERDQYDSYQSDRQTLNSQYSEQVQIFRENLDVKNTLNRLPYIVAGELVGTEAKRATREEHTHIEFNPGIFVGEINRPGATIAGYSIHTADGYDDVDTVVDADPQVNGFSMNPYPIIESIFSERSQMNGTER